MTVNKKMTAIADAIRSRTRETEKLSLDDMASGVNDVYDVGYAVGHADGYNQGYTDGEDYGMVNGVSLGKQNAYNEFWDVYQQNGERVAYLCAFGDGWTDELFKPKYPINALTYADRIFQGSDIKNVNVPIWIGSGSAQSLFQLSAVEYVQEIILTQPTNVLSWMSYAVVKEIRITCEGEGCLGKAGVTCTVNQLSHDSLVSIANALQDLVPLGKTYEWGIGSTNIAKLTTAEIAIATQKGWTVV